MNDEESRDLIAWIESNDVSDDATGTILTKYLNDNKDILWEDALQEHELL